MNRFINQIRLISTGRSVGGTGDFGDVPSESTGRHRAEQPQPGTSDHGRPRNRPDDGSLARQQREQLTLEAEKHTASLEKPTGEQFHDELFRGLTDYLKCMVSVEDDKFFHITCHVDPTLKQKIERGEYVDLERLLPKDRMSMKCIDQQALTLVNHDGNTYFVPAEHSSKITNVRRWEQAFRVYAAVYSNANPSRSAEIWQYVYVINTAAASYVWDNVAYYDYTFRQLMHKYPNRSWAKNYNQLWNLAMKDPIPKNDAQTHQSSYFSGGPGTSGPQQHTSGGGSQKYGDWRDRCCWRYNGAGCKKWNCRFDHKCNYCGSWSHNAKNCEKKKNKTKRHDKNKK